MNLQKKNIFLYLRPEGVLDLVYNYNFDISIQYYSIKKNQIAANEKGIEK